ncbi:ABC transporter ATP-binding protein [Rubripirellula reticaptiva]|uniref:Maltose/maltodextrin import ATP-binding protein MalK n=1 Tax=Rubripirellula reticaptiva TaxID=2528013 RepID=A0A5C6EL81_9BACT|nr:ABC transporter ATP-binding protein [Rubripirellula reticaptiva]TWU49205.1 Maltose/maltodextrin import ATP-binding protein MalK [Rubripirellula reticaptiva]
MIELNKLHVVAGDFALVDINLCIKPGQYAVLMGESGVGKTTILEAISGLRSASAGTIVVGDRNVTTMSPSQRNVGYVPQDLALFPTMTVREHLEFAPRLRGQSQKLIAQSVDPLVQRLSISHLMSRKPARLSGGEAQRVALGRALSFQPDALLLDEPLSALDESTRATLQSLLRSINRETGVTILHVTHDATEATALADVRFRLSSGNLDLDVIR